MSCRHTARPTATVCAIRQIRDHSRTCGSLPAREMLLRVERRMIQLLEDESALAMSSRPEQHCVSRCEPITDGMMAQV